jgi:RNAse (barnase) inhibitor barstar
MAGSGGLGATLDVMREIVLSGEGWATPDDVYAALLSSLEAPNWHGHNLDALWDSITGGDINRINPPFAIRVMGIDSLPENCKVLLNRIMDLISEAKAVGVDVEMLCS